MTDRPEHHLCTRCSCELTSSIVYLPSSRAPFCPSCAIIGLFRACQHEDGYQKRPFCFGEPMSPSEFIRDLASIPTPAELQAQFDLT